MPYVQRDENKNIVGDFEALQKGYAEEFVKDDDQGLLDFRAKIAKKFMPGPMGCSPLQARRALTAAGLRDSIESFIKAQDQDTQDAWQYAQTILRTDALLNAATEKLGMSQEQVDQLFKMAAEL